MNGINMIYFLMGCVVGALLHETYNDVSFWWKEYKLRKHIKKGDKDG